MSFLIKKFGVKNTNHYQTNVLCPILQGNIFEFEFQIFAKREVKEIVTMDGMPHLVNEIFYQYL